VISILILVALKFCLYCGIAIYAAKVFEFGVNNIVRFALTWGGIRLFVGLVFGFFIFYAFLLFVDGGMSEALAYFLTFGLSRYIEWTIVFAFMLWRHRKQMGIVAQRFILAGTAINIAIDQVAIASGLTNIKFFC